MVDTPGTNAILKYHQQITEHFVPRSDMVRDSSCCSLLTLASSSNK